jgi:hypothetical protein
LTLAACAGRPSLDGEPLSDRQLNLEDFFDGDLVAHGQFQDILGNVSRRFTVEIDGTWDGETLRLVEDFVYEDGSTEQRVWTLRKPARHLGGYGAGRHRHRHGARSRRHVQLAIHDRPADPRG